MTCQCPSKAASEPRLTEERSKAEIISALRRSDETQVLLPAQKFVPAERVKYAGACEIACGSEIRLRRVGERILFHIDRREIFHNSQSELFHIRRSRIFHWIWLHFCTMTTITKGSRTATPFCYCVITHSLIQ